MRTCRSERVPAGSAQVGNLPELLPAEVNEDPAEILRVLFHPVIERSDLLLVEEPEHTFLQLTRALAWDDLDDRRLFPHRLVEDLPKRPVDVVTPIVDVVKVQFQLHVIPPFPRGTATARNISLASGLPIETRTPSPANGRMVMRRAPATAGCDPIEPTPSPA